MITVIWHQLIHTWSHSVKLLLQYSYNKHTNNYHLNPATEWTLKCTMWITARLMSSCVWGFSHVSSKWFIYTQNHDLVKALSLIEHTVISKARQIKLKRSHISAKYFEEITNLLKIYKYKCFSCERWCLSHSRSIHWAISHRAFTESQKSSQFPTRLDKPFHQLSQLLKAKLNWRIKTASREIMLDIYTILLPVI